MPICFWTASLTRYRLEGAPKLGVSQLKVFYHEMSKFRLTMCRRIGFQFTQRRNDLNLWRINTHWKNGWPCLTPFWFWNSKWVQYGSCALCTLSDASFRVTFDQPSSVQAAHIVAQQQASSCLHNLWSNELTWCRHRIIIGGPSQKLTELFSVTKHEYCDGSRSNSSCVSKVDINKCTNYVGFLDFIESGVLVAI